MGRGGPVFAAGAPGYGRRGAGAAGRVAVADNLSPCDPAVAELVRRAAASVGAEPVPVAPFLALAKLLYDGPWMAERTSALRAMLDCPGSLHPVTLAIPTGGLDRRAADGFDALHLQAQVRRQADALFATHDVLLVLTAPFCPTLAELEADPGRT